MFKIMSIWILFSSLYIQEKNTQERLGNFLKSSLLDFKDYTKSHTNRIIDIGTPTCLISNNLGLFPTYYRL